jgi:uncharacterized membrane protein YadS
VSCLSGTERPSPLSIDNLRSTSWWAGLALAVSVAVAASFVAEWIGTSILGFDRSPVSAIMMAIILVPWFIVGFALMSALRTAGEFGTRPFGLLHPDQWEATVQFLRGSAETFLLVAMAGVGLTSMLSSMRRIGLRPFILGLFAAGIVGGVSLTLILLFAHDLAHALAAPH